MFNFRNLLPLVIGVSQIIFPTATLISQPPKNPCVYIVTAIIKWAVTAGLTSPALYDTAKKQGQNSVFQ